jgi:hypothetical protein
MTMKKKMLFLLCLWSVHNLNAQKQATIMPSFPRHEIGISYGVPYYNGYELSLGFTNFIFELADFLNPDVEKNVLDWRSIGYPTLHYRYYKNQRWSYAGQVAYNELNLSRTSVATGKILTNLNIRSVFLDIGGEFHYLKHSDWADLYSGIRVGYRFGKTKKEDFDSNTLSALFPIEEIVKTFYHVNLLGFRFGKKTAGFVELGFGAGSLVKGGVSCKF